MKRTLKRLIEAAATTLVIAALLLFITWSVGPRIMGWSPQVILTGSMEPSLRVGAVAFVEKVQPSHVVVGDVITFRHPEKPLVPVSLVTHRVVAVQPLGEGNYSFQTKGDANQSVDNWAVPASYLEGRVKFSVPHVGVWSGRVRSPLGFALLIGLPAAFIAISEVRTIRAMWAGRKPLAVQGEA